MDKMDKKESMFKNSQGMTSKPEDGPMKGFTYGMELASHGKMTVVDGMIDSLDGGMGYTNQRKHPLKSGKKGPRNATYRDVK